jgi:hypothetical protein
MHYASEPFSPLPGCSACATILHGQWTGQRSGREFGSHPVCSARAAAGGCSCLRSFARIAIQFLGRSLYRRHVDCRFAVRIDGIPKLLFFFFCGIPLPEPVHAIPLLHFLKPRRGSGRSISGHLFCIIDCCLHCPIQGVPLITKCAATSEGGTVRPHFLRPCKFCQIVAQADQQFLYSVDRRFLAGLGASHKSVA